MRDSANCGLTRICKATANRLVLNIDSNQHDKTSNNKLEPYIELLLIAGPRGLCPIGLGETLGTNNINAYASEVSNHAAMVRGGKHSFTGFYAAIDAMTYLNSLRLKRGSTLLPVDRLINVLKGWFTNEYH